MKAGARMAAALRGLVVVDCPNCFSFILSEKQLGSTAKAIRSDLVESRHHGSAFSKQDEGAQILAPIFPTAEILDVQNGVLIPAPLEP